MNIYIQPEKIYNIIVKSLDIHNTIKHDLTLKVKAALLSVSYLLISVPL